MIEDLTPRSTVPAARITLPIRLGVLGLVLLAEKFALGGLVASGRARNSEGFGAFVHDAQHWGFRFLVTFMALVAVLSYVRTQQRSHGGAGTAVVTAIRFRWLLLHVLLIAALVPVSYWLYRVEPASSTFAAMVFLWLLVAAIAVFTAGIALAPWKTWVHGIRSLGIGWLNAALAALIATGVWEQSENLWSSTAALTFRLVKAVLTPILPTMTADAATHVIRTNNFAVEVTQKCSGLEGLGLMLAFCIMWLVYFRREYIFPRALVLIPISLAAIFGLNVLRISVLMLIGNAGYGEVASYGFHSQAGWIAFNAVACALVYFSRRSASLNRSAVIVDTTETHNPTAPYLMPLLAILAAGVLSHALSGHFEILYPLRFVAGAGALYYYRRTILQFHWNFTCRGPAVGVFVGLVWLVAARELSPAGPMPWELQSFGPLGSSLWITVRALASITTVPIAEEIAYRGYLMRRLMNSDFESVSYRSVRLFAVLITAIVFGVAHGAFWLPGILAGIAYGLLLRHTGRIGEAVVAHAVSNALIVICVLAANMWQLW